MTQEKIRELFGNEMPTNANLDRDVKKELLLYREKIQEIRTILDDLDYRIEMQTYYLE